MSKILIEVNENLRTVLLGTTAHLTWGANYEKAPKWVVLAADHKNHLNFVSKLQHLFVHKNRPC